MSNIVEEFLIGVVAVAGTVLIVLAFSWNRVILDKGYIIVEEVKTHSYPKEHPEKYKVVGDGSLDWIDLYTDSLYSPGDTLYFSRHK